MRDLEALQRVSTPQHLRQMRVLLLLWHVETDINDGGPCVTHMPPTESFDTHGVRELPHTPRQGTVWNSASSKSKDKIKLLCL